jgi:hypothetical protein
MHATRFLATLVVLSGLALACSDRELPTGLPDQEPSIGLPSVSATARFAEAANDSHRAVVVRFETRFLFIALDFEKELLATHGWNEGGFPAICGDPVTVIHLGEVHRVLNPAEQQLLMDVFKAKDTFIRVYDWTGMPDIEDTICGGTILAKGMGRIVNTDNDLMPLPEHNRTNAFGFTAEGMLADLATGGTVHYNAVQKFIFDLDESGVTRFEENRRINLTPVGGD